MRRMASVSGSAVALAKSWGQCGRCGDSRSKIVRSVTNSSGLTGRVIGHPLQMGFRPAALAGQAHSLARLRAALDHAARVPAIGACGVKAAGEDAMEACPDGWGFGPHG